MPKGVGSGYSSRRLHINNIYDRRFEPIPVLTPEEVARRMQAQDAESGFALLAEAHEAWRHLPARPSDAKRRPLAKLSSLSMLVHPSFASAYATNEARQARVTRKGK